MFFVLDSNISFDALPGTINQKFLSMTAKRNNCPFCQEAFLYAKELYEHRKSLRHRRNHCAALYYNNRYVNYTQTPITPSFNLHLASFV